MSVEAGTTKHVLLSAYDDWFLRPLDLISIVLGLFYLYHRAWLLGLFLLAFGNLLGFVGQALNKEQSFRELAHKRHWLTRAEFATRVHEKLGKDGLRLGKAVAATWAALALAAALIAIHNGTQRYSAVWVGIEVGFVCQMLFLWGIALVLPLRVASNTASTKKIMWWAWALGPGAIVASNLQGSVLLLFCTAWFAVVFIACRKQKLRNGQEASVDGRAGMSPSKGGGGIFEERWSVDEIVLIWRLVGMALSGGVKPTENSEAAILVRGFLRELENRIGDCEEIKPRDPSNLSSVSIEASGKVWGFVFCILIAAFPNSDAPSARASGEILLKFTEQLGAELVSQGLLRPEQLDRFLQERRHSNFNRKDQPLESSLQEIADEDIPF